MKGLNWKSKAKLKGKNLLGWKTKRKIVVFAVDDYGNVRIDSKKAREQLNNAGLMINNRFDAFDALETRQDLEMLFEVLQSVADRHGQPAVFTLFALPCNIDFEKIRQGGYDGFYYELLPQTYRKKAKLEPASYEGAWDLWLEGLKDGIIKPQFHGREHLNLRVFEERLRKKDPELMIQLENRSFTGFNDSEQDNVSSLAAYDFWEFEENNKFYSIIEDGILKFEGAFGYSPSHFTPPSYRIHPVLFKTLKNNGIRWIDRAMVTMEHQGRGKFKKKLNYTGKREKSLNMMVRNVVFEPTDDRGVDWPSYAMKQIEAAFRWKRPAIISSHRVNFCGHIDPKNREKGLGALEELLKKITSRWPDVEFMSADELGTLIKPD